MTLARREKEPDFGVMSSEKLLAGLFGPIGGADYWRFKREMLA